MLKHGKKRAVILIVEDDLLIRIDAVDMVRSLGFDVVEAENAGAAVLVLEKRFDVVAVFTDIQMPGSMDGIKLAAAVRDRWPPIHIVATSGLIDVTEKDLPSGSRFLRKPYTVNAVAEALGALPRGL